jgi:uncharacterized cupin superfamily protein
MNPSSTTPSISKQRAPADIEQRIADWETWHCDSERYEHHYVTGATFYVVQGRARLTFSHGAEFDIEAGDFVSIGEGAEALWDVFAPIETRYAWSHNNGAASGACA